VLDDDALDDDVVDDELDPHPAMTAVTMATATAPAPALMRARSDLNIGPTLLSLARVPVRI
jgi:hypothetical protein